MAGFEEATILSLKEEFQHEIDPVTLAHELFLRGLISGTKQETVKELYMSCSGRDTACRYLLEHLIINVPLQCTIKCLFKAGYSHLACKVFRAFLDVSKNRIHVIQNSYSVNRNVHSYFWKLKQMVHDAMFSNPRNALRKLSNSHLMKMYGETDASKKQQLADRCVAILAAEIDSFYDSQLFESEMSQNDMLDVIKKITPFTSNEQVTNIVFCGRVANISAFAGEHDAAEQMLVSARTSAYSTGHCVEVLNLLYIEVYVKLWQFEHTPTECVRESLMMWGRLGLDYLVDEDDDARRFWKRMFILRMVYCLLGIGNRCNVISDCPKVEACTKMAQDLLAEFDQAWAGIETRREMFYCVARSRLNANLRNFDEALLYISRARKLAVEGNFTEKIPFINEYEHYLRTTRL